MFESIIQRNQCQSYNSISTNTRSLSLSIIVWGWGCGGPPARCWTRTRPIYRLGPFANPCTEHWVGGFVYVCSFKANGTTAACVTKNGLKKGRMRITGSTMVSYEEEKEEVKKQLKSHCLSLKAPVKACKASWISSWSPKLGDDEQRHTSVPVLTLTYW